MNITQKDLEEFHDFKADLILRVLKRLEDGGLLQSQAIELLKHFWLGETGLVKLFEE